MVISHTHYDHLDKESLAKINQKYGSDIHWFVPKNSGMLLENAGINMDNIHEMVWWEKQEMKNTSIVFTPSNHYSRRGIFDLNLALWGSFAVIGKQGNRFWFGGDTAYCDVFKQIGKRFGPFQLSAIPIGAYSPRKALKFNHVDPDEAVLIHHDIKSELSIGIHWGTFKLGAREFYLEPKEKIEQAQNDLSQKTDGEDVLDFYTINIGSTQEGKSADMASTL